jgi:hypothetical protein
MRSLDTYFDYKRKNLDTIVDGITGKPIIESITNIFKNIASKRYTSKYHIKK